MKSLNEAVKEKYGMPNTSFKTVGRLIWRTRKKAILGGLSCYGNEEKRIYVTWKRSDRASVIVGYNFSFDAAMKRTRKTFKGINGQLDRAVDF